MPFLTISDLPVRQPRPGWESRFFHSEHVTFAYTEVAAGADVHPHQHEQEEVFYVIDGELEVRIGDEVASVHAGDVAIVPSQIEHAVRAATACRLLVVDYPLRESVGGVPTR
jgi:quercetin dioxygenase-like cupin family protein